ncbi:MAG TPA: hypothetical protein VGK73_17395, partial [Polyangiaceae bacterium]
MRGAAPYAFLALVCAAATALAAPPKPECARYDEETGDCQAYKVQAKANPRIKLAGLPANAVVHRFGKEICRLPCEDVELPGEREDPIILFVSATGYRSQVVRVGARETQYQQIALQSCPVFEFAEVREQTTIYMNDRRVGIWPEDFRDAEQKVTAASVTARLASIAPGPKAARAASCPLLPQDYTFRFELADHRPWVSPTFHADYDTASVVKPVYVKRTGTILVTSPIGNATVLLDGVPIADLPFAGKSDLVLELPEVSLGKHQVSLALPEEAALADFGQWGAFRHESHEVRVEDGQIAEVVFSLPFVRAQDDPTRYQVNRDELEEFCENEPRACVALGWARRWGVSGPVDLAGAAAAFAKACRDAPMRSASHVQGCTAYAWMNEMGLVPRAARDDIEQPVFSYQCASAEAFPDDPLSPCVRARLSHESQAQIDPTLYVEHAPDNTRAGFPISLSAGAGPGQQFLRVAFGLSGSLGPFMIDGWFTAGAARYEQWDVDYAAQEWNNTGTFGLEAGPAYQWLPYSYLLAHFSFESVVYGLGESQRNGTLVGARVAVGFTPSRVAR